MDGYTLACTGNAVYGDRTVAERERGDSIYLSLGYPAYILTLFGAWKILGAVAVLMPKFPLVKEWAYAGFFFAMSGAIFSHIAMGSGLKEMFGPLLLLALTVVSWHFRPANRKIIPIAIGTGNQ